MIPFRKLIAILLTLFTSFNYAWADNDSTNNIVNRIQIESKGDININIPQSLMDIIYAPVKIQPTKKAKTVKANVLRSGVNKLSGYRVQVFSQGHNQGSVEARAKARGSAVAAKFPKYRGQIYSYSQSPNWYTRVGNFQTASEANAALSELKRAFPQFAGEMRVVKCQIRIVK